MPRPPVEPQAPAAAPVAPPSDETPTPDGSSDGMLDLDEEDQINNQHLEVR